MHANLGKHKVIETFGNQHKSNMKAACTKNLVKHKVCETFGNQHESNMKATCIKTL
jgi:hypothetical protein